MAVACKEDEIMPVLFIQTHHKILFIEINYRLCDARIKYVAF